MLIKIKTQLIIIYEIYITTYITCKKITLRHMTITKYAPEFFTDDATERVFLPN